MASKRRGIEGGLVDKEKAEESRVQNEEDEVDNLAHQVNDMELVFARFQLRNPRTFLGVEGGLVDKGWITLCNPTTMPRNTSLTTWCKLVPLLRMLTVIRVIDIEEGVLNMQSQVQPQVTQGFHPVPTVMYSFYPPQMSQQQPSRQRFKPRGKQFKKKYISSSACSDSSGGSGRGQCFVESVEASTDFTLYLGTRHMSSLWVAETLCEGVSFC
ncbi:bifunctional riboflavin biosynthesis protein RIBA 1, chloroplastic [Dorcoceras hygrometricum]|uniref:Bifunctional riboflavin biosynthesis protein RIBA 1, chloroplastic n=1 Tax=Dorcoceras hygrometricum TaxID=472368 RepID=A0A2Z7A8S4_9LAMI|nr:bifunctional riboflavin biosynthesis protein RIBA 1, chloroplastic [Dorcoceras hygrometricum]